MRIQQISGIALIVVGFIVAVSVGFYFSLQAQSGLSISDIFPWAIITFIFLLPLFAGGIMLYNRSANTAVGSTTFSQRVLLDYLRTSGKTSIVTAAADLGVSSDEIRDYLRDLIEMDLFCGFWDQSEDVISILDCTVIRSLDHCVQCHSPITPEQFPFSCHTCETMYYVIT